MIGSKLIKSAQLPGGVRVNIVLKDILCRRGVGIGDSRTLRSAVQSSILMGVLAIPKVGILSMKSETATGHLSLLTAGPFIADARSKDNSKWLRHR